ncbi:MAG: hypothetical protein KAI71_05475 [Candidatus Pacebacteria bacterium]|nr:hypothetical protein [Candidatus Paceibacterota bacterium]
MKKVKLIGFLVVLVLFFALPKLIDAAFTFQVTCQPPMNNFHDGNLTFDVVFPPGGGTTCVTIADCPKVALPAGSTVYSVKVDMEITDPALEVGTPFIWIPNSGSHTLTQMRTNDGTIVRVFTAGDIAVDSATCSVPVVATANFNNPSRITVMPGGDVWLANRGNDTVTRLSPKDGIVIGGTCGDGACNVGENNGNCPIDCIEYEVKCNYPVGGGPRGVTYDLNGKIWVSGYTNNNMYKFNIDGSLALGPFTVGGGVPSYGMIGDASGYVWISDRLSNPDQIVKINATTNVVISSTAISNDAAYGIGVDDEGDIWIGNYLGAEVAVHQIDGATGANITPAGLPNVACCGVAVDQNNVVWVARCNASPGSVYAFNQDGTLLTGSPLTGFPTGNLTRGIAVDFDGNIWAVNRIGSAPGGNPVLDPSGCGGTGSVTKLAPDGSYIATYATCGTNPYCYSDMTGLRTVPKNIVVNGISVPLSAGGTFEICTDMIEDCDSPFKNSGPCMSITTFLAGCSPGATGDCEVPLEIFSMQAGGYTLKNLEVIYSSEVPVTAGGLVPCGRDWDDPDTAWNDTEPCGICHFVFLAYSIINLLVGLVAAVSILALIVAGLIYIKSSGDASLILAAKQNVNKILYGFVIVFIAWVVIYIIMVLFGLVDPLGDGRWNIFSC